MQNKAELLILFVVNKKFQKRALGGPYSICNNYKVVVRGLTVFHASSKLKITKLNSSSLAVVVVIVLRNDRKVFVHGSY